MNGIANQEFLIDDVVRAHLALRTLTPTIHFASEVRMSSGGMRQQIGAHVTDCGWFPENTRDELEDIAVLILNEPFDEIRHPDLAAADFEPEDIGTRIEIGQLAYRNPRSRRRATYSSCYR